MSPCLLCCTVLQLFLLGNAQYYLTVYPVDPVVSVGSSIQLNCSLNCLGTVAWKGLDIYQNNQYNALGYSVQTLENISVSMGGMKFCEGTCPGERKSHHKSVELHVYALPKTLFLSNTVKNGVHYLNCSVERVLPPLYITCYRGSETLGEATEMNEVPVDEDLYNIMGSWVIPKEDWLTETLYRCEAEVSVNGQVFKSEGILNTSRKVETTTTVTVSSTTQVTSVQSQKPEASYMITTTSASPDLQTMQESTTRRSQQSTTSGEYTTNATLQMVTTYSAQPTATKVLRKPMVETTRAVTVSSTTQVTSVQSQKPEASYVITTTSASPDPQTMQESTTRRSQQSTTSDGLNLMWTIVPATGLVGSFLVFLQILRQLRKKGFFQPSQKECSTVKNGSLQAVFSHDMSTKKESSMY